METVQLPDWVAATVPVTVTDPETPTVHVPCWATARPAEVVTTWRTLAPGLTVVA